MIAFRTKYINEKAAKTVAQLATKALKVEANTNSCMFVYQPKAPKELAHFRDK